MPVPNPEEVLEVAAQLAEARTVVAQLESRWASFFTAAAPNVLIAPAQNLKPRIIQFLEQKPMMSYTMVEVSKALNANENSVGPYLSELAKDEKIEKRGRGLYGALREQQEVSDTVTLDDDPFALRTRSSATITGH